MSYFSNFISKFNLANNPAFIAAQLRKPHGFFAKKVAKKMNENNQQLYRLVLDNICACNGDSMLEIGFGNGKYLIDFINKADNITMFGVEFSESMMQEAGKLNAALIKNNQLKIQLVRSEILPFESNSLNAIIAINLIYFWENPAENLKEIYRVLLPGGRLYIGLRPAEILSKLPIAQYGFHLRGEAEWIQVMEQQNLSFIHSQISKEQNIIINKKEYVMQGQCMVFEK